MPAYFRSSIEDFLTTSDATVVAALTTAYANDGYLSQYTSATVAWTVTLPALRDELSLLLAHAPYAQTWQVLLEFPLYRLRRRIDAVVICPDAVICLELKTAATRFEAADKRQAEEYAQDLRDFHAGSRNSKLYPLLWALDAEYEPLPSEVCLSNPGVAKLSLVGRKGLSDLLFKLGGQSGFKSSHLSEAAGRQWDCAAYAPVPSVVDAAINLYAGHGVREITLAGAKNLGEAADAVFSIIEEARDTSTHTVVFLTGAPGAGKTLAGLGISHSAVADRSRAEGEVVYLSGNTPLVVVLREALARDQHRRLTTTGTASTLRECRTSTRATIQHINDFLKQYVHGSTEPPSGRVIVFDEAQRAWDARQGKEKFGRDASEPFLVLEAMSRHPGWSVTVCLIGVGQEINDGEEGVAGWADAVESLSELSGRSWAIYGPTRIYGSERTVDALGAVVDHVRTSLNDALHLDVPMRSFRSPELGDWIATLLDGKIVEAKEFAKCLNYPLFVTRSLIVAKKWLKRVTAGERRMGLLASSGARRLRADGIGEVLSATDGSSIAHWYLNPPGDIRSSYALEVPANEYTSQGLELDFACLCWGGDLTLRNGAWLTRSLAGNRWNEISDPKRANFVRNSYRVLLSRAREGLVIWVPEGNVEDPTRNPYEFDQVAAQLLLAGAQEIT